MRVNDNAYTDEGVIDRLPRPRKQRTCERQKTNVFDLAHIWPQGQFPQRKVGEFTLNESAVNYFAEIEQIAFNPAHMPPGIEPLCRSRLAVSTLFLSRILTVTASASTTRNSPSTLPEQPTSIANSNVTEKWHSTTRVPAPTTSLPSTPFNSALAPSISTRRMVILRVKQLITFLREFRPEDFDAPRALGQKFWDEPARERFINNVTGKMALCKQQEPLKCQIAIFREVDPEIAERLEKSTGIEGYDRITNMSFNRTHNSMSKDAKNKLANSISATKGKSIAENNSAPFPESLTLSIRNEGMRICIKIDYRQV